MKINLLKRTHEFSSMKYPIDKLWFFFGLVICNSLSVNCQESKANGPASGVSHVRKLVPGRTSETFYHPKLKKTILINGAYTPGAWHTNYIELWQWNGLDWELLIDNGPETRNFFSWAYDSKRNILVLYSGINIPERGKRKNFSDTWEWDGKSWHSVVLPANPGIISAAKMVYDPVRGACILFGGNNEKIQNLGDTWSYNGKEWKQIFTTGPIPRAPAAMFYYPVTKKVYVYGGHAPTSLANRGNLGDMWELNDTGWNQLTLSTSPGIRALAEAVYNEKTKTIWMIDGDAWMFDGKKWEQQLIKGLPPRNGHGLSYDASSRSIMVQGGVNIPGGPRLKDTWILEEKSNQWKCLAGCIETLVKTLAAHPDDSDAALSLLSTWYYLNEQNARAYLTETIRSGSLVRNSYQRLGGYFLSVKKYKEATMCLEKALEMKPDGGDYYDLACGYAQMNNADKAFQALNKAVENGFNSKKQFEGDTDLEPVKSDARWKILVEKLK
jgi:tetratricopeptide (TPR) repeat protein